MRYKQARVVFQEVPNEVTLAIEVTGCPNHCPGCHSPELLDPEGVELDYLEMETLLRRHYPFITCVCFMGGDHEPDALCDLLWYVSAHGLRTALYSGREGVPYRIVDRLNYLKVGSYVEALGGLRSSTTNQRFYKIENGDLIDKTAWFRTGR